jgi:hypothetical protein
MSHRVGGKAPERSDQNNRFIQLWALAADPNEDTAECARADLFHELVIQDLTSDWIPYLLGSVPIVAAHDS